MEPENKKLKTNNNSHPNHHCVGCQECDKNCIVCNTYPNIGKIICSSYCMFHNNDNIKIIKILDTNEVIEESLKLNYEDDSIILINKEYNFIYFHNIYFVITKCNDRYMGCMIANKKLSITDESVKYDNVLQNTRYLDFDKVLNPLNEYNNYYIIADSFNKYYLHKLIRYFDINDIKYILLSDIFDNDYIHDERKKLYNFISEESILYYYN